LGKKNEPKTICALQGQHIDTEIDLENDLCWAYSPLMDVGISISYGVAIR
jgi:hypothetical protein